MVRPKKRSVKRVLREYDVKEIMNAQNLFSELNGAKTTYINYLSVQNVYV